MSTTAKVLIVVFLGIIMSVTTLGGAAIYVFTTPLDTSANDIGAGPGALIVHLVVYGATGALIGGLIGLLLWAVTSFFVLRIKQPSPPIINGGTQPQHPQ